MKALLAVAVLLVAAGTAEAGDLAVIVRTDDGTGAMVPVPGAAVAIAAVDGTVAPEDAIAWPAATTDGEGRAGVPAAVRGEGPAIVLAGAPFRGFAFARVEASDGAVTLVLPDEATAEGKVVDGEGRPVAAAEVRLTPETGEALAAFGAGRIVWKGLTDTDGTFRIVRLAKGSRYALAVRAPPFAPLTRRDFDPASGAASVALSPGAAIRGLVLAVPGGRPLAGAEVRAGEAGGRSGADGTFVVRGIAPGAVRVTVAAPGVLDADEVTLSLRAGEERAGLTLRVRAAGKMRGRILLADTRPAAGGEVFFRYPADLAKGLPSRVIAGPRCDADGWFTSGDLEPALGVDLIARHPDGAPAAYLGYSVDPGVLLEVVILLREGATISGRVVAGDTGAGIAGAAVGAVDSAEIPSGPLPAVADLPPTATTAITGADGAFTLRHVAPGRLVVLAEAAGRPPGAVLGLELATATTREGLGIVLGPGAPLAGAVRGPDGKPVAGAVVKAAGEGGLAAEATTSSDGAFSVAGLPAGVYGVTVTAAGFAPFAAADVVAPKTDLAVSLVRTASIIGRVTGDPGEVVPGTTVRALARQDRDPAAPDRPAYRVAAPSRRAAGAGATFTFEGLPPGTYRLEAYCEDGRFGLVDGVAPDGDPVEIALSPGFPVEGRVVNGATGRAVEAAEVSLRGAADSPAPAAALTDVEGRFRLNGLPPGFHTLAVLAEGFAPALVRGVEVREAAETNLPDVVLVEGATIEGTVVDGDAPSARGLAGVTLRNEAAGIVLRILTRRDGTFTIEHAAAGDWTVSVDDRVSRREVLFRVPESGEVRVTLGAETGTTVSGRVTRRGEPAAHALVTALRLSADLAEERAVLSARSKEDGGYELRDLEPGAYLLFVEVPGLPGGVRVPLRVASGPSQTFDLRLPDSGIEGRVEYEDGGAPLAGAELVLTADESGPSGFLALLTREVGRTVSDGEGRFSFPAVAPGVYAVSAFRPGCGQAAVRGIRVLPGGATEVRVVMTKGGRLLVRVLTDRGRPATDARVRITDAAGLPATRPEELPCDGDGSCRTDGLRTGVYTVEATAEGCARARVAGVEVFAGGEPEVEVRLKPEGRLKVTVVGPGGWPVAGARLALTDFFGRPVPFSEPAAGLRSAYREPDLTDETGTLTVTGLPAGIYEVSASFPGYVGKPARVRVVDGEQSRGSIVLAPVDEKPAGK